MDKVEWVAGLLEGEGTFYRVSHSYSPHAACSMTDLDVLETLHNAVGVGSLRPIKKRQDHWKDAWIWRAQGDDAVYVMESIHPYMGIRRRQKIDELLDLWYNGARKYRQPSENVLAAVKFYRDGLGSLRETAKRFHVGKDTINKYSKL